MIVSPLSFISTFWAASRGFSSPVTTWRKKPSSSSRRSMSSQPLRSGRAQSFPDALGLYNLPFFKPLAQIGAERLDVLAIALELSCFLP